MTSIASPILPPTLPKILPKRHRTFLAITFSVLLILLSCPQTGAAGFTVEQVLSSPVPTQLVAAKRRPRIAWVFNRKGERNVWIADAPGFAARQVTHYLGDDGQAIASLKISDGGDAVVYARGSEANDSGHIADPGSKLQEPKQQVWALDLDRSNSEPRLLGEMNCKDEGCEEIHISPDGRWAVWTAKDTLGIAPLNAGAGRNGSPPASSSSPGSSAGETTTKARKLHELQGDSSDPQWSPDGRQIAFRLNRNDHSFIAIIDVTPSSGYSAESAPAVRYLAPSVDRDQIPRWSPDGKQLVFVRENGKQNKLPLIPILPQPWALWVADVATGEARQVWHSTNTVEGSLPPSEDGALKFGAGERIVFSSEQDGRDHLYSISTAGSSEPVLLTPGNFDVEDVTLTSSGDSIIYTSNQYSEDRNDEDRRHIWAVGLAGGKPHQLSQGKTIEWAPVELSANAPRNNRQNASPPKQDNLQNVQIQVVCLGSTATTPAMPYHLTSHGREMIAKEMLPADFPSAELIVPEQVIFKSEDGLTLHGQLFVPQSRRAGKPGPALIFTHGGPMRQMLLGFHYMYYYHNAYAENQYLANRGYVVLSVNYRLGVMYGRAFRRAPNSEWRGAAEYKDVLAGAKFLQNLPFVDKKRIGLWGGSYGGFLTALGLARNSDIFAAGVDFHGVHDWSIFLPHWEPASGAPDAREASQLAWESSPDSAVGTWKSPVLLIQGDDDRNVPFNQTVDLAQRLRRQNVPFEQLVFPDDIHDFLLWKHWVRAYQATAEFFDRKLKPAN